MKADVKTVEFLLSYKQRDVEKIRRSHKLRRRDAEVLIVHSHVLIVVGSLLSFQVIRVIIAAGLYPQYTIPDPLNKYQVFFIPNLSKIYT